MGFERGGTEWNMMADWYRLVERYWNVKKDDAWWDAMIRETDEYVNKYKTDDEVDNTFIKKIILALLERAEGLERREYRGYAETERRVAPE